MAEILEWDGMTTLDLPPDQVLEKARGHLKEVVLIGIDANGELYVSSSKGACKDVYWLLQKGAKFILEYECE